MPRSVEHDLAKLDAVTAQRDALADVLRECIPYVNGAMHSDQPWRRETAEGIMQRIRDALGEP